MAGAPNDDIARRYAELGETVRPHREGADAIRPGCLITLPYDHPGRDAEVAIDTEEFTALCPWTGLPDFGRLAVRYVPGAKCLELKSLKYYLTSYRNVGILQEHAVNRILGDLVALLGPASMTVEAAYRERGGIKTRAVATYQKGQA